MYLVLETQHYGQLKHFNINYNILHYLLGRQIQFTQMQEMATSSIQEVQPYTMTSTLDIHAPTTMQERIVYKLSTNDQPGQSRPSVQKRKPYPNKQVGACIPEEKPSEQASIPRPRPSVRKRKPQPAKQVGACIPEEKPSEQASIPRPRPSVRKRKPHPTKQVGACIPEEKPSEQASIPRPRPSVRKRKPQPAKQVGACIPEEKPSEQASIPRPRPSVRKRKPQPDKQVGACIPEEKPSEQVSKQVGAFMQELKPSEQTSMPKPKLPIQETKLVVEKEKRSIQIHQCKQQAKPTCLYFSLKYDTNESEFEYYLECQLHLKKETFTIVSFQKNEQGEIEVEVQFHSMNQARRAQQILSQRNPKSRMIVSLQQITNTDLHAAKILQIRKSFEKRRQCLLGEHKKKISCIRERKCVLEEKSKKLDLGEFHVVLGEIDTVKRQINEFTDHEIEFKSCYHHLQRMLDDMESKGTGNTMEFEQLIARECLRFQKALPIYARRQDIVKTVHDNQVVILIGETGSGKSTQVVQYLYDDGFAEHGCIVCTQPRKVAAVTLANHVGTEMCIPAGTLVGHCTSATRKVRSDTKIIYMTDHGLLNECISDRHFSKYSCLVIDEAHERSLSTDMLLAFIKECLPYRPDLKVIIMSATIKPDLFVQYFGHCPIINVFGRAFPVDIIWNPLNSIELPLQRQYVQDAIVVVKQIHNEEPRDGGILVFLTAPPEIERACETLQQELGESAIVLPLHGKLHPQDQQKVFKQYTEKRKIVLSTNVAETSVTIPDIKYIVDTGLAKELCFDAKKNMNSLEVRLISKSSADQRKGRAGRVSAGKCYRLYSEETYKAMQDRTLPEILRVHLTHAVLKLYEFGISNILAFNFLEMPVKNALLNAINTLHYIGAIENECLTSFGQKLALLPVDPLLGKVLLDGIDAGIGYEAAISVAVSSLGGNIFFRGRTEEMKAESDRKKIKFIHPEGDQLTSLVVYQEWSSQKKDQRNKWCVENYINAKSMRIVEETVKEFKTILTHNLQCTISNTINLLNAEAKLPKIFFYAFLGNIAVYLGHEKVGYMTLKIEEPLIVFPGSSLIQTNQVPKYLIYEKTLKLSQHFLLQAMPVDDLWIKEAISLNKLSCDPIEKFNNYLVTPLTVSNIGQKVYECTIKKPVQSIQDEITAVTDGTPFYMDCRPELGLVRVYVSTHHHTAIKELFKAKLRKTQDEMKAKKSQEIGITGQQDDVRVILGSGGTVEHILMPCDYRTVVVKGPIDGPNTDWSDQIMEVLLKCGSITVTNTNSKKESCFYVTFDNHVSASKAVETLSNLQSGVYVQPVYPSKKFQGRKAFTLKIEWSRRKRRNFVFLQFHSAGDAQSAHDSLSVNVIAISIPGAKSESTLKFQPSQNDPTEIFVANVPTCMSAEDIRTSMESYLFDIQFEVKLVYEKPFVTTEEDVEDLQDELESIISQYCSQGQYNVNLSVPKDHFCKFQAFVDFLNPQEGLQAIEGLQSESIDEKELEIQMIRSSIRCFNKVYKVIKSEIATIEAKLHNKYKSLIKIEQKKDKYGNIFIEISATDISVFMKARNKLHSLTSPLVIECQTPDRQQYLLSHTCRQHISKTQATTSTYVYANLQIMTINIYGAKLNQNKAFSQVNEQIEIFEDHGFGVHEIHLKAPDRAPGLMKHLVTKFGTDLQGIIEMNDVENAMLDPQRQILSVFAKNDAITKINQVIDDYTKSFPTTGLQKSITESQPECCVCLCDIENTHDIIRLEYCGHPYHIECMRLQVSQNTLTIPLLCAAEDCSQHFVWEDFETLFKRTPLTLPNLVEASLRSYLVANQDKVRNCLTPDCKMVYAVTEDGQRFICSHCSVHICTTCHVQYHYGLTCEIYKDMKSGGDKALENWMHKNSKKRKRCPKCAAPIEKTDGCNHVTCSQCHSHICWVCLDYFDTDQLCYAHLVKTHGDIF